jgi:hypothetical protein
LTQNTSGKDQKKEICPGHPTFRRLERSATAVMPGRESTVPPRRRPSFEEEIGCFSSFFLHREENNFASETWYFPSLGLEMGQEIDTLISYAENFLFHNLFPNISQFKLETLKTHYACCNANV